MSRLGAAYAGRLSSLFRNHSSPTPLTEIGPGEFRAVLGLAFGKRVTRRDSIGRRRIQMSLFIGVRAKRILFVTIASVLITLTTGTALLAQTASVTGTLTDSSGA